MISKGKSNQDDFFRWPSIIWLILVPIGMALVFVGHLAPSYIPWGVLIEPIATTLRYLVDKQPSVLSGIFYAAIGLHFFESLFAFHLCQKKNLSSGWKWFLLTNVYGIFALKHLLAYHPKQH